MLAAPIFHLLNASRSISRKSAIRSLVNIDYSALAAELLVQFSSEKAVAKGCLNAGPYRGVILGDNVGVGKTITVCAIRLTYLNTCALEL